jgi:cysteinyl-tRNA synthetase
MKIYNSLKREKQDFVSVRKGRVGMYVCGPTVYDEPHIGHARSAYVFDVIRKYLVYKGYKVNFVRNVTDVDDKIIDKARSSVNAEGGGDLKVSVKEISKRYLDAYRRDMSLLNIGMPDSEPMATEYIPKMIDFIGLLIRNGRAYDSDGDVYFDMKKAASYGKLSNQSAERMAAGSRIVPGEKKHDPLDFALWKKAKDDEPSWQSPWGNGRPGWHIECSAMSSDILGDEFDIHGGGIDLIFPHHENEIAQSEGAGKKFARYWMHNGLLTIESEKMSKSLGNFITISGFLSKYKDPDYLKLLFLGTHYRHPVDYSEEKVDEARAQKERFLILSEKISRASAGTAHPTRRASPEASGEKIFRERFEAAMDDDFNTPLALGALFDLVTFANKLMRDRPEDIVELEGIKSLVSELGGVLGLDLTNAAGGSSDDGFIAEMISRRDRARKSGDYSKADKIRRELLEKGIILEDAKDLTTWRKKI